MASPMTYTRCPICEGLQPNTCPCVRTDTPGWAPTGLTLAQMDRLVDLRRVLDGDPGVEPTKAGAILAGVAAKLRRLGIAVP